MEFPIYRKYKNDKSYFKIHSAGHFTEVMFIGERKEVYEFHAKIFPDIQLIQDMIKMENGSYDEIDEATFLASLPSK